MTDAAPTMAIPPLQRLLYVLATLITLVGNLIPLYGVLYWQWDTFQLLMLYWLETAVIAFWTILRIATMPPGALGDIQIGDSGGKKIAAPLALAAFFTVHAGIFMAVHFLFLWALFSGHWSREIHGIGDFVTQMVIGTRLWVPLLFLFFGRGAVILFEAVKPWLWRKLGLAQRVLGRAQGALGPGETLLFGLYIRIVVMQVTIIIGAWFALLLGNVGALLFLIAVKTAVDLSFQIIAEHFHAAWLKAKAEQAATP
jgi:Family of unknown function (DUF6498)